jgi:hypothetical protein
VVSEACLSHPATGLYTVKHFIEGETMPGAGILYTHLARPLAPASRWRETPLQVAAALKVTRRPH